MFRYMLTLFVVATLALPAGADVIVLTNGDRISGKLIELPDQQAAAFVKVMHPSIGEILIPADDVQAIVSSVEAVEPAQAQAPDPADVSKKTDSSQPKGATTAQADDAPAAAIAQPEPEPIKNPGILGTSFLQGWDKSVELAVSGAQGNTENMNFRIGADGSYEDDEDRWLFDAAWYYTTSNDRKTKNNITAGLTKDWLLPDSDWFLFALGRYDYDEFKDYLHRFSGGTGGGYQIVKNERWDVRARAGLNVIKEIDGPNPEPGVTPEALLGVVEAIWKITKNQTMNVSNTMYPALSDIGEFRNITKFEWRIKFQQAKGLSFKTGIKNEYETNVTSPTKRNDLKYFAGLVYDF